MDINSETNIETDETIARQLVWDYYLVWVQFRRHAI